MRRASRLTLLSGLLAALAAAPAPAAQSPKHLKLIVLLVVDQMRSDYIDRFGDQWRGGLRRLVDEGAWFREAAYPYANTITCAGHATIATGSLPASHGIILNEWWERETKQQVSCTEDERARALSYAGEAQGGHGPSRLLLPTLSDELRAQLEGESRVVTFSVKARSAIMLGGHRADAVTWFDEVARGWVTTSAYATAPVPFVESFVKAHPIERDLGKAWTRLLPESAYLFEDAAAFEKPSVGWTAEFPHALSEPRFYSRWARSPLSDAYLAELAKAAVDALSLGRGRGTDYLGVSFSSLDSSGHDFGPKSHEVQDTLARLDGTLGDFLAHLDRTVGAQNYVVALSSDHGVAPIPEQMAALGFDAGRVAMPDVISRVEKVLATLWGPSPEGSRYVARMAYTDFYFAPGVWKRLLAEPAARVAALDAIRGAPGVWRVLPSDELTGSRASDDPAARAAALSYYPGRSGDLVVLPKPYWFFANESGGNAATHGSPHAYDARVPVILMGSSIKPGRYLSPATPADIAPTLALLAGVTLARPDGRVLSEALSGESGQRPTAGYSKE